MKKLVEEMSYLELGGFEGEWEEYERLDDWMREAQEYGVLVDEDEQMVDVNVRESGNDIDEDVTNMTNIADLFHESLDNYHLSLLFSLKICSLGVELET